VSIRGGDDEAVRSATHGRRAGGPPLSHLGPSTLLISSSESKSLRRPSDEASLFRLLLPTPLLLFDLWNDHWCVRPVNEDHPDLVEKYTEFLENQWEAHQDLAQLFTRRGEVELTAEQLQTLRALGYIQ